MARERRPDASHPDWVLLGVIAAPVGIKGAVRITSYAENPASFADLGPLHDGPGGPLLRLVVERAAGAAGVVARVHGVEDRNAAEKLRGKRLYVPRKSLPPLEEDDTFYHHDLVGLAVRDEEGVDLGVVAHVANYGAGDILEVALSDGRRVPVAFTRAFVPVVDVAGGRIVIARAAFEDLSGEGGREDGP